MGPRVGGDPDTISSGAAALSSSGRSIGQAASSIDRAGQQGSAAAAIDPIAGAISRFAAAYSQTAQDVETEMSAASSLASNAAADLQTAGGGGHPR